MQDAVDGIETKAGHGEAESTKGKRQGGKGVQNDWQRGKNESREVKGRSKTYGKRNQRILQ